MWVYVVCECVSVSGVVVCVDVCLWCECVCRVVWVCDVCVCVFN